MIHYRNEKEEIEKEFEKVKVYEKELLPEMIPPDQTFKIFLHFIKHLQYEDVLYTKLINTNDINNIKHFLNKVETKKEKVILFNIRDILMTIYVQE